VREAGGTPAVVWNVDSALNEVIPQVLDEHPS
jgi:hypothetical protein